MLNNIQLEDVLCLDIETVPQFPSYTDVPPEFQKLWVRKASNLKYDEDADENTIYERAGIYAEFGKIICITTGFLSNKEGQRMFRLKSFYGDDEKVLLENFAELLRQIAEQRKKTGRAPMILCGHNAKEFDFPYMCRRM